MAHEAPTLFLPVMARHKQRQSLECGTLLIRFELVPLAKCWDALASTRRVKLPELQKQWVNLLSLRRVSAGFLPWGAGGCLCLRLVLFSLCLCYVLFIGRVCMGYG